MNSIALATMTLMPSSVLASKRKHAIGASARQRSCTIVAGILVTYERQHDMWAFEARMPKRFDIGFAQVHDAGMIVAAGK